MNPLSLDWATSGSPWRGLIWCALWICITVLPIIFIINTFVIDPTLDKVNQSIADSKAKSQAEHDKVLSMSCQELGTWLLQDNWYDKDNLILAQNHYLVECKTR